MVSQRREVRDQEAPPKMAAGRRSEPETTGIVRGSKRAEVQPPMQPWAKSVGSLKCSLRFLLQLLRLLRQEARELLSRASR